MTASLQDGHDSFRLTDLTKTAFDGIQNKWFRHFTPVKLERRRLPTSLPEFHASRFSAALSDSPLTAASKLGGTWEDHNLACILHVAKCNLRCTYCYVDFALLSGKESFWSTPQEIVNAFAEGYSTKYNTRRPSILRISGGEPLLVPRLALGIYKELNDRALLDNTILKIESNMTALPYTLEMMTRAELDELTEHAKNIVVHATLHARPSEPLWNDIMAGLRAALGLGFDLYPAIGGSNWNKSDLELCYSELRAIQPNLPLRLAVRPFSLDYGVLQQRKGISDYSQQSHWNPIHEWDSLLRSQMGQGYLEVPRHAICLA